MRQTGVICAATGSSCVTWPCGATPTSAAACGGALATYTAASSGDGGAARSTASTSGGAGAHATASGGAYDGSQCGGGAAWRTGYDQYGCETTTVAAAATLPGGGTGPLITVIVGANVTRWKCASAATGDGAALCWLTPLLERDTGWRAASSESVRSESTTPRVNHSLSDTRQSRQPLNRTACQSHVNRTACQSLYVSIALHVNHLLRMSITLQSKVFTSVEKFFLFYSHHIHFQFSLQYRVEILIMKKTST